MAQVTVTGGQAAAVQLTLEQAVHMNEVVVTVSPEARMSPDHAVNTDPPLDAERIEVVRGPATLLYGSSAEGEQNRVAPLETSTPGYTFLNSSLGYRFFTGRFVQDVMLSGTNLTDEFAENHVSFLKDRVPLLGRNMSLSYRLSF